MKKTKRNQAGFTLIELALIIAVLGILGAVGAVKLASMTTEANEAARKTAIANARSGLAIAIAKDANGSVTPAELANFLEGVTGTPTFDNFVMDGYTLTFSGDANGITGVTNATKN